MNSKIMFLWGFIIFSLCATLLIIGYNQKDKVLIKLERSIVLNSKKYVDNNNIKVKDEEVYIIKIEDLIEKEYIKENDNIEKYCIKAVFVTKGLLSYKYEINKECDVEKLINDN